ncbi:hypothetical protein F9828_02890 [Streptococcus suis]|nr:hypothetical protein [Streptococcus suis]
MRLSNSALKSTVICSPFQCRHLVYLLLLRRARKHRFLISNFKHSTGVFELTLPNSSYACGSLPSSKSKPKDYIKVSLFYHKMKEISEVKRRKEVGLPTSFYFFQADRSATTVNKTSVDELRAVSQES